MKDVGLSRFTSLRNIASTMENTNKVVGLSRSHFFKKRVPGVCTVKSVLPLAQVPALINGKFGQGFFVKISFFE
jgi:hypothetical protein